MQLNVTGHKTCAHISDDLYGLINNVPKNVKFLCAPRSSVFSTVFEMRKCMVGWCLVLG